MSETFLDGRVTMLLGDVRERLRGLPADHFDCVVTSPPYWGLRDYGTAKWLGGDDFCAHEVIDTKRTAWANSVKGPNGSGKNGSTYANMTKEVGGRCAKCEAVRVDHQIGLEPTLGEHLAVMVEVFEEVRRVLKPTGTLWLNYGDCYATAPNGRSAADIKLLGTDDRTYRDKPFSTIGPVYQPTDGARGEFKSGDRQSRVESAGRIGGGYLKSKDLCMIPNRLAIALQEAGWWVRSEIIWHKPNPMPESITDRPTTSHEKIWLLTKSERYFYDAEAIREPVSESTHARLSQDVQNQIGSERANGGSRSDRPMKAVGRNSRQNVDRVPDPRKKQDGHGRRHVGFNARWEEGQRKLAEAGSGIKNNDSFDAAMAIMPDSRNSRNVWTIPTAAFSEAHFATFPPALAERCIKAGSPAGGSILDPFGGSGTTALVAACLGRTATLIELNPEYATLARARIEAAFMGREEGARHMVKKLGKLAVDAGPLFQQVLDSGIT
jgi:DNA modification methylase